MIETGIVEEAWKVFSEWESSLTKITEIGTRKAFLEKRVDFSFWKVDWVGP